MTTIASTPRMAARLLLAAAAVATALAAGPAPAQPAATSPLATPPTGASKPPATSLSTDDLRFIDEAILTAAMGVETASMALEVSADPTLLAYARSAARDYRALAAELARIAQSKGVQPEQRLPEAPEVTKLRSLKGAEFDRMFVQIVAVDANRQALALFQRQAEIGKDPALRAFAKRALPMLEERLSQGKSMSTRTVTWRSGIAQR